MRRFGHRRQRTLVRPAEVGGVGFVTGERVRVRFRPAPVDAGVSFVRTDLPGTPRTSRPASTRSPAPPGGRPSARRAAGVTLVEHVLAALAGLRIDNCFVELDAPEPPGLDGSAGGFVERPARGRVPCCSTARRGLLGGDRTVVVAHGGATLALHPPTGDGLTVSYLLDYGPAARSPGRRTPGRHPGAFARDLARLPHVPAGGRGGRAAAAGVGRHLTPADLLVFGPRGPIDNRLRYANEPARHKVLDMVGDLALFGFDLGGHVVAYRSGHPLNVELAAAPLHRGRSGPATRTAPRPAA